MQTRSLALGLTFDDILLLPGYADFTRDDIELTTHLTQNIILAIPFVAAPMDTVCERNVAIALGRVGGIGFIHRNFDKKTQAKEVAKVKKAGVLVGAAVGTSPGFEERMHLLVEAGVDCLLIDSAHGYTKWVINAAGYAKQHFPKIDVIAGNVATYDGTRALIEAGANAIRVGMGPGAICTTRIVSGMGVPQVTAIAEAVRAAKGTNVPIIADGGMKYSGDFVKALALGASTVMMGSFFASSVESPGKVVTLTAKQVPEKFRNLIKKGVNRYQFKEYRGMGSVGAMKKGAKVLSEDEFHGKSYFANKVLVAEGVESLVPVKGTVKDLVDQALGGIRSGMYYVGAKSIHELAKKAQFIQITQASLTESHPHDVLITNAGDSY